MTQPQPSLATRWRPASLALALCMGLTLGSAQASTPLQAPMAESSVLGAVSSSHTRPRLSLLLGDPTAASSAGAPSQSFSAQADDLDAGRGFSWSLQAWQLNTASLAHIRCDRHVVTLDAFVAEDCRFVDQPVPEDVVNLVQIRGQWTAAPGLALGLSAFASEQSGLTDSSWTPRSAGTGQLQTALRQWDRNPTPATQGLGLDISFGIQNERLGEFLVGLQLARYQQRMSLSDLQGSSLQWLVDNDFGTRFDGQSTELALGWRRGRLSGELIGRSREEALIIGGQRVPASLNSFDLEFSWNAPGNASFSVGISNLLDNAPRSDEALMDVVGEDAYEQSIYGRIPYVRYKHDL